MNLSINRWVFKNKQNQAANLRALLSLWLTPTSAQTGVQRGSLLIKLTIMLSISPHTQPFYSFSSLPSPSWLPPLRFFTWLILSCHHSHLNPVRRRPDRADWFPVRRCLERILELSGCVHPPLLHSNLRGRPCLLLRLCCRHTHTHKIHKSLHTHTHTSTWSPQYSNFSIWLFLPKGPA